MNPDFIEFILEILSGNIKEGVYVMHLDEYADVGTHWMALYALNVVYFDSLGVEHVSKEI